MKARVQGVSLVRHAGHTRQAELSDPETKDARLLRRRFRMPYAMFLKLVDEIKGARWKGFTTDEFEIGGTGTRRCIPVELKVRTSAVVGFVCEARVVVRVCCAAVGVCCTCRVA